MTATQLNKQFDELGAKYDKYFSQLSKKVRNTVQGTISNWQDWYFNEDNYGNWKNFEDWINKYNIAVNALSKAIKKNKLKEETPKIYTSTKKIELEPITIKGYSPLLLGIFMVVLGGGGYALYKYKSKHA